MSLRPLPTPWNVFNLTGSPYWQEALEAGDPTHPLDLFVGRTGELDRLLAGLHGAGVNSSRQAVAGGAGVGKTTLVKQLKARALEDAYLTIDAFVPILSQDTAESLFGRVLSAVYDTILSNRPMAVNNPAMEAAQVLVRAARLRTGGGGASAFGFSLSASQGATLTVPRDMLIDGPRVLRDLMALVRDADARGVLLHINNLENLSEADVAHAGVLLRDLRDPMLMHGGLHVVLVGTTDAVQAAVNAHQQVRTTFSVLPLEPFAAADVHAMLMGRYAHMRLDPGLPPTPPADDHAVEALYGLFRGDLRGLLKALDDGVTPNIGLAATLATTQGTASTAIRPLTVDDLRPTLQQRYADHLATLREEHRVAQLTTWGTRDPAAHHTQKSLGALWKVSQGAVSTALAYLIGQGYVVALPRKAGQATQYALSGVSRLIFG